MLIRFLLSQPCCVAAIAGSFVAVVIAVVVITMIAVAMVICVAMMVQLAMVIAVAMAIRDLVVEWEFVPPQSYV